MRGAEDNKSLMAFIAIAIIGFLVISSPGWKQILGIEGMEQQVLVAIILVFIVGGIFWVVKSSSGGK